MSPLRRLSPLMCALAAVSACGPGPTSAGRYVVELAPAGDSWESGLLVAQPGVLTSQKAALQAALPSLSVVEPLDQLPMLVADVDGEETYRALAASPLVAHLWPDSRYELSDTASFGWAAQPATLAAGITGAGATVAVLDTGVNYTNPAFGTCSKPGAPGCAVAFVKDFAPDDGSLDDNGHGTNVSGIVVGMAPGARVVGLDVFTGSGAYSSDIISAINWVIANRATYNIVALNMSLGSGLSSTPCPTDVFSTPIAAARAAGVLSVVASGNGAQTAGLSSPACAPAAISVGAVYDAPLGRVGYGNCTDATTAAGQVTCFSNSASFLSILAPGANITAAGITMYGTSQASPHVAGALALLASKYPSDTASKRASRLLSGAPTIRDPRNGVTRPRLMLGSNPGACAVTVTPETATVPVTGGTLAFTVTPTAATCSWTLTGAPSWLPPSVTSGTGPGSFKLTVPANPGAARTDALQVAGVLVTVSQAADLTPPTGTLTLPALTPSPTVTATLTASDPSGVPSMCIAATPSCTTWRTWAASVAVTLPAGDGVKTVYLWLRDGRGNTSATPLTATTKLDTTAPVGGKLTATASAGTIKLAWSGFTDATSGVAKYRLVQSTTTSDPPAGCATGTVYEGTGLSAAVVVPAKTTRRFRVCAFDGVGNVGAGVVASATTP